MWRQQLCNLCRQRRWLLSWTMKECLSRVMPYFCRLITGFRANSSLFGPDVNNLLSDELLLPRGAEKHPSDTHTHTHTHNSGLRDVWGRLPDPAHERLFNTHLSLQQFRSFPQNWDDAKYPKKEQSICLNFGKFHKKATFWMKSWKTSFLWSKIQ